MISWTAPNNNYGAITAYKIEILEADGVTYSEDSTDCDGTLGSIVSATSCTVP